MLRTQSAQRVEVRFRETQRVTPDAVIYRYMQLIAPTRADVDSLCLLLSVDADLLTRWLQLLNIPADLNSLKSRIEDLDPSEFQNLAAAQAWSVLPIVGSARLSFDQWLSVVRAACVAEVLARYAVEEQHQTLPDSFDNVRLRALLAISGVQLESDPRLKALIEFRGTNPALLEDAALELRIFAVIDALEIGREVELAQQLLNMSADTFNALLNDADQKTSALVQALAVSSSEEVDWAHRIWLKQQINIVTSGFSQCQTWQDVHMLHQLVSRCLFSEAPLLLYQTLPDAPLQLANNSEFSITPNSRISLLAATARGTTGRTLQEGADLAVVDRLILRALDSDDAWLAPMQIGECTALLIVASDEDSEVEITAELYADALSQHIQQVAQPIEELAAPGLELVEQFRTNEYKRLREIVHEANNPLSIVHNYLHILELRLQHEPEAVEQLNLIGSELRRAADVFTRARDIPEQLQVEVTLPGEAIELEVNTWISGIVELHSGLALQRSIALRSILSQQAILVHTEQDKLTQIVSNLLKNALEACTNGDVVSLAARAGVYRNGLLGMELSVEDTGPGLSEEVLQNLNNSKQSTKGGDHQGVGIQIAFRLSAELDGALDVRTQSGQGTTFTLFLPLQRH